MTLSEAIRALASISAPDLLTDLLPDQADSLADKVRLSLGSTPGGSHDQPWKETGELQASIAASTDGLMAAVGSNDPAAAAQEFGTRTVPPRPFLSPVAATEAEPIARSIGEALVAAIRGCLG